MDSPKAQCPICKKMLAWDKSSPWRPFCSERCKLIDLGEWLDEGYRVADEKENKPFLPPEEDSR